MNVHQQITQLRKDGQLEQAYALAREHYVVGGFNSFPLVSAYAWVLYSFIKREAHLVAEDKQAEINVHGKLYGWLREYAQLYPQPEPNMVHSNILRETLKVSKSWDGFLNFAYWFGIERLQEEDYQGFKMDNGKEAMSIAEQFYNAIGRHLVTNHDKCKPEVIAWAEAMIKQGLVRFANSQWLAYQQAKWLVTQGDYARAEALLITIVKRMPKQAWTWAALGWVYRTTAPNKAITCFYYATELARKEDEVAKVRVYLAQLLATENRFNEAVQQLEKARLYRANNNYRIPADLSLLMSSPWYQAADVVSLVKIKMASVQQQALPLIGMQARENTTNSSTGASERVKMTGKLVKHEDKDFAFIRVNEKQSIFVSPSLLARLRDDKDRNALSCWTVPSSDKNGKPSLKAITWV